MEPRVLLAAQLLADINLDTPGSSPAQYTRLGDEVLFVANDGVAGGYALWKTDGTSGGTSLVKLTLPNAAPSAITLLPALSDDLALFWASDPQHGKELWRTDGTPGGTSLLKDINPGEASSPRSAGSSFGLDVPDRPVVIDGVLYFQANDGTHGLELWRSDGTADGTRMVKDVWPGATQSSIAFQVEVGGLLYFAAGDSTGSNKKLFRSNGTEAGTFAVSDTSFIAPRDLAAKGDELYFFALAPGSTTHHILHRGNGTEAGTVAVSSPLFLGGSSNPGTSGSAFSGITAVGDSVYFKADDGVNGFELWKSDAAGVTSMLKNIGTGSVGSSPLNFTDVNGIVYFTTAGSTRALWKSDGSEAGTVPVPGAARAVGASSSGASLAVLDGVVYYAGADPTTSALELWRTDGTEAGSFALTDDFWTNNIWPQHLAAINGALYFAHSSAGQGAEPWTSNGTIAGTVQITDLNATQTIGSAPRNLAVIGNVGYFIAGNAATGSELWRTDGTTAGTYLLKDINPGRGGSGLSSFTEAGGIVYFLASDGTHGQELWRTDGTEAGTYLVKDVQPGPNAGATPRLAVLNNTLYFSGTDGPYKTQLWKTDGTEAGTVIVKDFSLGGTSSIFIYSPIAYNGQLYFGVGNYTTAELWRTTGTEAGTHKAFGDSPPSALVGVDNLRVANNTLFFTTNTHTNDYKLFRSDGTLFNTMRVSAPTGLPGDAKGLTVIGEKLYFWGTGGGNGYEPHVTDGTTEGSFKLREINAGSASSGNTSNLSAFIAGGDHVYFGAIEGGTTGEQLWRTDGTAAGTERIGGPTVSLPARAAWLNGRLYFTAIGGGTGFELWSYDSASGAVTLAADIRAGSSGSSPINVVELNDKLVFTANDGQHGEEVWRYLPTTADAGGPYTVAEGAAIPLSGSGADPTGQPIVSYEWDFSYNGTTFNAEAAGGTTTFSAAGLDGRMTPPSFVTVALRVTDAFGGQMIATQQVQVTNVAPTLRPLGGDLHTSINQYFRPIFGFDDPGNEAFTATARFDDGTNLSGSQQFGAREFMLSGYFETPGSHLMTVTVTDSDGATDTASVMVHVAAAPPAGVLPENDSAGWYQQDGKLYVTQGTIIFTEAADLDDLEIVARPLASGWASPRFRGSIRARAVSTINGEIGFDGASGNVLEVQRLTMDGGVMDFGRNALIVTDQPLAEIDVLIKAGRTLAGGGIASTDALNSGGLTAVGSATAGQLFNLTAGQTQLWNGRTVDAAAVLIRYTYAGDANLDGTINIDDYGRIDSNVGVGAASWFNGDFNFDGKINIDDYGIIDTNISRQGDLPL